MLKDLVFKEIAKEKALKELMLKCAGHWRLSPLRSWQFYFENAEQIAKEKQEILNKKIEYTKEYWIEIFKEAGFEYDNLSHKLGYDLEEHRYIIDLHKNTLSMYIYQFEEEYEIEADGISPMLYYNDPETIEFYYNIFRNILNYESNKLNGVNAGGGH